MPYWTHDCEKCELLCSIEFPRKRDSKVDIYVCNDDVVYRYSDEPSDYGSWSYSLDYIMSTNASRSIGKEETFIAMILANNKYGDVSLSEVLYTLNRIRQLFHHEFEMIQHRHDTEERAANNGISYEEQLSRDLEEVINNV